MIVPFKKFYGKISVCFFLNIGKYILRGFILKPTEIAYDLLKDGTRDFQNSFPFERLPCFYETTRRSLNVFNTLTLKHIFGETKS